MVEEGEGHYPEEGVEEVAEVVTGLTLWVEEVVKAVTARAL